MPRAIRVLLCLAVLAPILYVVGCQNSDSVANTELGQAPVIPPGRGMDPSGKGPVDPGARNQPRK